MIKRIFPIDIAFEFKDAELTKIVEKEFGGYQNVEHADLVLREVRRFEATILSNNPATHIEHPDGFTISNRLADIRFIFSAQRLSKIEFRINEKPGLKTVLRKVNDMQFTSRRERIGQMLHELILVPLTFFQKDLLPVHSSGVIGEDGKAILFGGTGGVGKTSLELRLASKGGIGFVTDDVAIVHQDGNVYPNLNFPKIYAYNTVGNKVLERQLNTTVLEGVHWAAMRRIRGAARVRRRIDPRKLYGDVAVNRVPVGTFYFLHRGDQPSITVEDVSVNDAVNMSNLIIMNEYASFLQHLRWHELNCVLQGRTPFLTERELDLRWSQTAMSFFSEVSVKAIRIPMNIDHKKMMDGIEAIVMK